MVAGAGTAPPRAWWRSALAPGDARVRLLALVMAVSASGLLALLHGARDGVLAQWWLLLPLFGVAEILVIHVPTVRSSHAHSLREVPAIVGLAFLAPADYVLAYALGSGLALLLWSRQRGLKLAFNVSMFALEAALGCLAYDALLGDAAAWEPRGWFAALAAVLVTDLVSALAVTAAISLTEGAFDDQVLRESLRAGVPAAMVNTCMALLVVVLVVRSPEALPLLAAVLLMLVVAYRAYVTLGTGYSRLQLLYRFVGAADRPHDLDDTAAALLVDARDLLRAGGAELVVLPSSQEPGSRRTLSGDAAGDPARSTFLAEGPGDLWWAPAMTGKPVLLRHDAKASRVRSASTGRATGAGPRDGIAVPLLVDGAVHGVLLVTDRTFELETFSREDLRLFETLAAHAAVALDKARLVDRLRRLAAQREHEALHDALTGLPNRRSFVASLSAELRAQARVAVVLLDLDDFKDVNDTLGHSAGDELLRMVGQRLAASVDGVVAHLGGDEFGVLMPGAHPDEALAEARRLRAALGHPLSVHGVTLIVQASAGVAVAGEHGSDADEVLSAADVAMYSAKAASTGAELYRLEDGEATQRRLVLARDLASALPARALEVWFQPQARASDGRVTGAEALLRWHHPVYGCVPPPEVVAVAERTGLLRALTDQVLEESLRRRAQWQRAGHDLDVSVNVTPADLADEGLVDVVSRLLDATDTLPGRLTVEITESGVMHDPERCLAVLDRLAALGVRLSVDDFGTGHSSLAYLDRLPVHEVKIDRSFVLRLGREESDSTVVRATVSLAHQLGMHVVAEGVETDAMQRRVRDLGCELVQGYGLARPMPPGDLERWLARRAAPALPTGATAR